LDIFRSQLTENNWVQAENLGYPINTSKDDFGLICDEDENSGYFSTNRLNDKDKIYSFKKNPPIITLKGILTEKANGKPIRNASLQLKSAESNKVLTTDVNGNFFATLANNADYTIIADEKNFFLTSAQFTSKGFRKAVELEVPIALEKVTFNKPVIWRGIAFDKGSTALKKETKLELDKLNSILKDNPDIKIELSSHTDARASDKENLILSQARADAAAEYLFSKGIARDRIAAVGYGSLKLLNNCVKGVLCLEEDHMLNVRTEIKYLNYTK
jgi:outer membrane protein OmpA-like peptidoglycan-associated protein